MKFLLEFVTCCASCPSAAQQQPAEETRLLVVQKPRRRVGRRLRGGCRGWRPSLSSISEDVLMVEPSNDVERPLAAGWQRIAKLKKVASSSRRDRRRSLDRDYDRDSNLQRRVKADSGNEKKEEKRRPIISSSMRGYKWLLL